jgi:RNA polymerase sigma-70 factor (ECF subfamily)
MQQSETDRNLADREAVEAALGGNPEAFRVLVERHSRSLFRLAFRMSGSEDDAEEIVQETFLRAYRQLHHYDGRASFGTWVYTIAANYSRDLIRARNRRSEWNRAGPAGNPEASDPLELVAAGDPGPERQAYGAQVRRLLAPAMKRLSEMERTAFVLRHYEGMSMEEISGALGIQANAAKQCVFRAVQKLRRALEPAVSAAK